VSAAVDSDGGQSATKLLNFSYFAVNVMIFLRGCHYIYCKLFILLEENSLRIQHDMILQVCNDCFDHDAFSVVGTSAGTVRSLSVDHQPQEGSYHAFVAKINLDKFWVRNLTHRRERNHQLIGR
jgi:hypothetical protein